MDVQASTPTNFLGKKLKKQVTSAVNYHGKSSNINRFKVMAKELDEGKQTDQDRWKGLAYDISDDQQDITRGKGFVDSLFQAPTGDGTHEAVLSSYEYLSQGLRTYVLNLICTPHQSILFIIFIYMLN
jgi:protein tyrosine/serine phosphatase